MTKFNKFNKHKIRPWREYKLYVIVFILVIISELIGPRRIFLTGTISIVFMPLLYAMVLGLILFLAKPIKFIQNHESKVAESLTIFFTVPIIAKLAVSSGQSVNTLSFMPTIFYSNWVI
ncbi:DUF3100 domain-containing protein [uncultured Methanobrevibacter sp.]|uniref:DUF3100 domain-containing protein n=1 Tax=uncultured Methanobrevibacter sp. TaxID=253161 RepID=UPI0025E2B9AC|nr:DUF3100 domain-containing protein [uncultured Methanobrevibacter sp.]